MENNLKFNSAVCTTRSQSERLLSLGLKKETADCGIYYSELAGCDRMFAKIETEFDADEIPAWSLHRLFQIYLNGMVSSSWNMAKFSWDDLIDCIESRIKGGILTRSICLSSDNDIMVRGAYSIGELIEFLEHRIYRIENDMQWLVDGVRVYRADEELINALFEACVTLKEEGVI